MIATPIANCFLMALLIVLDQVFITVDNRTRQGDMNGHARSLRSGKEEALLALVLDILIVDAEPALHYLLMSEVRDFQCPSSGIRSRTYVKIPFSVKAQHESPCLRPRQRDFRCPDAASLDRVIEMHRGSIACRGRWPGAKGAKPGSNRKTHPPC